MRIIKFRAWDKKEKRMETNVGISFSDVGTSVVLETMMVNPNDWVAERPQENYELMQYTGLKDIKNREIYEGDIVKHRKMTKPTDSAMYGIQEGIISDTPQTVKWESGGFTPFHMWVQSAIEGLQYEVIGNIYENKELLK